MSTQSAFRWSTWIGIDIDDPDLRVTPGSTLHAGILHE
jgi:hypothetical protein